MSDHHSDNTTTVITGEEQAPLEQVSINTIKAVLEAVDLFCSNYQVKPKAKRDLIVAMCQMERDYPNVDSLTLRDKMLEHMSHIRLELLLEKAAAKKAS